ncbi:MAG: DNA-binding response regulator [Arcobacter sp.]|uniref:DNA-binding response regulator n=1 Tax=uncultured Arcobacter sp. TaxID=165434 RepID=UPI000CAA896B|nr:DNA-binding response regulator [uncultured Arcobacter sp.]PLY08190.1 MAG: DNA-binding response regulator [Arcobacter sp.]
MCKNSLNEISILIIEDEVVLSLGLKSTLKSFGYSISGIETTLEGSIKHLTTLTPTLAIVDIKLQGINNGITIAKYLWQTKKIPIIFLTSYCDEKTIEKTLSCEPYGYLIKPCKDKELHTTIQTAINKHNYFFKNKDALNDNTHYIDLGESLKFHKGKSILFKNDEPLKLTNNETKLLELLSDYLKEPVSFERISNYIWRESIYDLGKLRTLVYRLKLKIGVDIIESVFESGYKLKVN